MEFFLSYARDDKDLAESLASILGSEGQHTVWADWSSLRPGESIPEKIKQAIASSDLLAAVIKEGVNPSPNVMAEIGMAIGSRKQVLLFHFAKEQKSSEYIITKMDLLEGTEGADVKVKFEGVTETTRLKGERTVDLASLFKTDTNEHSSR